MLSSGNSGFSTSETLQAFITRACDEYRGEPDLSLNLEIAEYVNSMKANTPREAAVATIKLINNRNQHVSMLALYLLDILVKNCGYPFHLQIATKEFLNELVRRFPERPPSLYPPPMAKILELVHEWKATICVSSRHKEDLVHIRDMHRLLSYKGYRFPDYDKRAASVLNPTDNLKSPDELEEDDRSAQAAKLQELIRRGTPKDLAAAQKLMKIMSGAEPERRPDYEGQTQKELQIIQQRILMLNEMLDNARPNERFVEGDSFDQIASRSRAVQPKIQKWISDASENDPDQMDKLLLINDLINQVLDRYTAFKKGDRQAVADINPAFMKTTSTRDKSGATTTRTKAAPLNLIDFDDSEAAPSPSPSTPTASGSQSQGPMSDLDALSSLSLGSGSTSYSNPQQLFGSNTSNNALPLDLFGSSTPPPLPASSSTTSWNVSAPQQQSSRPTSAMSLPINQNQSTAYQPNYYGAQPQQATQQRQVGQTLSGLSMNGQQQQKQNGQPVLTQTQPQGKKADPFEDLLL